jgi:fused signal recognition particle receptor
MAGFFKKVFSFGKKEVVEKPAEDEALAPINWDALKELRREDAPAPAQNVAPVPPLDGEGGERSEPGGVSDEVQAPPSVLPADFPVEPDLPVEVPGEPEIPSAPAPHVPPAPEPPAKPERPIEVPAEPETPREVPAEPVVPTRPEPEIPPAPQPEKPKKAPVEIPPAPEPPVPERPVEIPAEPAVPSENPAEPAVPTRPEPEILPAPELRAPEKPETPPLPSALPPSPLREGPVSEGSDADDIAASSVEIATEADRGGGGPGSRADAATSLEAPRPSPTELPPPRTAATSQAQATGIARPSDPRTGEGGRTLTDPEALAPIDWEGLKAFRRQDEPQPAPAEPSSKVTVAKKVEQKKAPAPAPAPEPRLTWYQRLRQGLARSSRELSGNIAGIFTKRKLDEETLQDLEDVLIRADLGVETAMRVTDTLASTRYGKEISDQEVRAVMATEVEKVLTPVAQALELDLSHKPHVILVVGVNGTGKTTTIGKLAAKLKEGGLSVMLAAGDTFRAAAIEQLKIWGERTGSPVVSSKLGADAAGLAFDAFVQAKEEGSDVLIIDTAGRLQNKTELMAELEKIVRVLGKHDPEAPHTVLQTVDATTGQNALNQVEIFRNVAGVNGLVMTKLDGTARGGILVAIAAKYKLPVYFIGVGEQVDDLEPFSAGDFAKAIAGVGE